MFFAKNNNLKFSFPQFHTKYFWKKYSIQEFKQNFVKICAFERNRKTKHNAYYWQTIRMQMVKYFEDNFGEVPDILKSRRMPNDPFLPSMDNEFKSWLEANHNK